MASPTARSIAIIQMVSGKREAVAVNWMAATLWNVAIAHWCIARRMVRKNETGLQTFCMGNGGLLVGRHKENLRKCVLHREAPERVL